MATRTTRRRQDASTPAAPPGLRQMERQMAALTRLLEEHEFETLDEANAFLQNALATGSLPEAEPTTPLEQAQDLIYQAMEATGKRRLDLARKALTISADCADAYVLLAEATTDPREARCLYEQGVQAGERALGPEIFKYDAGHFWGILETRPYMRARQGLANVLWHLGEQREAIEHLQAMLKLNPDDNQGLRYVLGNWLLVAGDDATLEKLLKRYPEAWGAQWTYTRLLLTFRQSGAGRKAEGRLKKAMEANPHVPLYLLGARPLPKRMPGYYGMGDANEAVWYVMESAQAWVETPGALEWLAEALTRLVAPHAAIEAVRRRSRK